MHADIEDAREEGRKQERNLIVEAVMKLRAGESEQSLLDAGIPQEVVETARMLK